MKVSPLLMRPYPPEASCSVESTSVEYEEVLRLRERTGVVLVSALVLVSATRTMVVYSNGLLQWSTLEYGNELVVDRQEKLEAPWEGLEGCDSKDSKRRMSGTVTFSWTATRRVICCDEFSFFWSDESFLFHVVHDGALASKSTLQVFHRNDCFFMLLLCDFDHAHVL